MSNQIYGLGSPICGTQNRRTLTGAFTAVVYTAASFPSSGPLVIYNCGPTTFSSFTGAPPPVGYAVGQADPPEEERVLLVRAALNDDVPAPAVGVGLPTEARVPLGGFLRLDAIDDEGQALPADFVLNAAALAPGVAPTALFRDLALLPYTGGPINGATYQAVHKGRVTITIRPSNADILGGTLTVIVEDPLRLG